MSSITLVVEERSKVSLLRGLLRLETGIAFRFFAGSGRITLATLGRNILVHEGGPLMIVMDAASSEDSSSMVEAALRSVSPYDLFDVFAFVPELEVIFFETPNVLVRKFGTGSVNSSVIDRGCLRPKPTLQEILQSSGTEELSYYQGLTSEDLDELRQGEQASKFISAVESLTVRVGR